MRNKVSRFDFRIKNNFWKSKRSQLTIFIIIAIVIAAIILILLWPRIKIFVSPVSAPQDYIQGCLEKNIEDTSNKISLQGGSLNPENYIMYNDSPVEYLCYTNEYYKPCLMQQPLIREHIENEIEKEISVKAVICINNFKDAMVNKGYSVDVGKIETSAEIIPKNIVIKIDSVINLRKGEESQSFKSFKISVKNNIYTLLMISTSILNWEARYGDSDPLTYMLYYPSLKVEKYIQGDGSKIYILTDRNTQDKFIFATRSIAWPPGYGAGERYEKT